MKICSKCGDEHNRKDQRYCLFCHAEYMRENRPVYGELTDEQKKKDNCRSMAGVYLRREKLTREPCKYCGDKDSQMHHEDYDKPLFITWLCVLCHLGLHKKKNMGMTVEEIDAKYLS